MRIFEEFDETGKFVAQAEQFEPTVPHGWTVKERTIDDIQAPTTGWIRDSLGPDGKTVWVAPQPPDPTVVAWAMLQNLDEKMPDWAIDLINVLGVDVTKLSADTQAMMTQKAQAKSILSAAKATGVAK